MNHDAAPSSSAAGRRPAHDDAHDAGESSQQGDGRDGAAGRSQSRTRKDKAGLAKKFQFMTDLMTSLDMIVFAELCTLYYMDCSFFRLIIRSTAQSFFLSPKTDDFLLLLPAHRPHVFAIFVPNILCMLLHLFSRLPQASEESRGYLHGGVMIDFIGQKAPTSRLGLLLLDVAVLGLQCFMLAVHLERERLRKLVLPLRRPAGAAAAGAEVGAEVSAEATASTAVPSTQDHDAEERGVLRDDSLLDETNDIEMRSMSGREGQGPRDEDGESSRLLADAATQGAASPDLGDMLRSGNAVLADFHVVKAIRTAGNDYQSAAEHSLQTIGYAATLARLAAQRQARLNTRPR